MASQTAEEMVGTMAVSSVEAMGLPKAAVKVAKKAGVTDVLKAVLTVVGWVGGMGNPTAGSSDVRMVAMMDSVMVSSTAGSTAVQLVLALAGQKVAQTVAYWVALTVDVMADDWDAQMDA